MYHPCRHVHKKNCQNRIRMVCEPRQIVYTPNDSASGLLALTGTFHSTTQEPAFAQAQSSDHASVPMNSTTSSSGSKMHSLGEGISLLSAGDATSSYEVRSTQMGIDHALSMLRNGKDVAILLDVNGANLAANFSYILLLSNLGDPV